MAITVALVIVLGGVAFGVSLLANKRKPDTPTVPRFVLPYQLDRSDFDGTNLEWLLVLFSSQTCDSCITVLNRINKLAIENLHVQNVEFPSGKYLHTKYSVGSVPSLLLASPEGIVKWSFAGIPPTGALESALENFGIVPPETGQYVHIS